MFGGVADPGRWQLQSSASSNASDVDDVPAPAPPRRLPRSGRFGNAAHRQWLREVSQASVHVAAPSVAEAPQPQASSRPLVEMMRIVGKPVHQALALAVQEGSVDESTDSSASRLRDHCLGPSPRRVCALDVEARSLQMKRHTFKDGNRNIVFANLPSAK